LLLDEGASRSLSVAPESEYILDLYDSRRTYFGDFGVGLVVVGGITEQGHGLAWTHSSYCTASGDGANLGYQGLSSMRETSATPLARAVASRPEVNIDLRGFTSMSP